MFYSNTKVPVLSVANAFFLSQPTLAAPMKEYLSRKHAYIILTPLKPYFYIVKLGFTEVYIIFLISAKKHRLWVRFKSASARRF